MPGMTRRIRRDPSHLSRPTFANGTEFDCAETKRAEFAQHPGCRQHRPPAGDLANPPRDGCPRYIDVRHRPSLLCFQNQLCRPGASEITAELLQRLLRTLRKENRNQLCHDILTYVIETIRSRWARAADMWGAVWPGYIRRQRPSSRRCSAQRYRREHPTPRCDPGHLA